MLLPYQKLLSYLLLAAWVLNGFFFNPDLRVITLVLMLAQGTVNISATYNTRHHDFESSVVARGDLWRLESSRGNLSSGNDSSPLFLVQLGPLLFVRDSTLLLPVHLSKQHLLWYGYDRKVLLSPFFRLDVILSYVCGHSNCIVTSNLFDYFLYTMIALKFSM
jgi:hypothetical protein